MKKSLIALSILAALVVLLEPEWHGMARLRSQSPWPKWMGDTLFLEAQQSLESKDVPVAALLVYKGKVVGRGHNTILMNKNAAGHAEINAISDAFHRLNIHDFNHLDKDKLRLFTTYEPCDMCAGALRLYGITQVIFGLKKSSQHWLRNWLQKWRYDLHSAHSGADTIQLQLFTQHPNYPGRYKD